MKIIWVNERVGYISGATTTGVVKLDENRAVLIDSALNKDSAKKIDRILASEGLVPALVINTHSHADHFGGNSYFLQKHNVRVGAPKGELSIFLFPQWEPFYLYGGAPPEEMLVPFLMAEPTEVHFPLLPGKFKFEAAEFEVIDLGGHSPFQVGVLVDGYLFAADALFFEDVWQKHRFVYFADVDKAVQSLKNILKLRLEGIVLAHTGFFANVEQVVKFNLDQIQLFADTILSYFKQSALSIDELLEQMILEFKPDINSFPSYFLARQTVISYLTFLLRRGILKGEVTAGRLLFKRTG